MTADQLVALCSSRGIRLWAEGGRLRYEAPEGALTPDLRALLAARRESLIASFENGTAVTPELCPLSYNQQFLWFLYQLDPASAAYNVAFAARVVSPLDPDRMEKAFQKLVARHPMLRATYDSAGGVPVMKVHDSIPFACERVDAAGWSDAALEQEVRRRYREPFDLVRGPVLRVHLFEHAPGDVVLLLTIHHIACDGWSLGILLRELRDLYFMDTALELSAPGTGYRDFIRHQARMLSEAEGERLRQFWMQQLSGELQEINLPLDKPRPQVRRAVGSTHSFSITGELYQRMASLARRSGATLYTFLLASFQTLLMRYGCQEDILLATPMATRPRREDDNTVGCYINPVVLRGTVPADASFEELLQRTRKVFTDAFDHRHYPFPLLVEQVSPERDPGRTPLFHVMFNFLNRQTLGDLADLLYRDRSEASVGESVPFGELSLKPFPLCQEEGQADLALETIDNGASLTALLRYSTDLFHEDTVSRMADNFRVLLEGIVSRPGLRLSELPLLTPGEREEQLVLRNRTRVERRGGCIHERFEEQARRTPGAPAVEFEGSRLTYAELDVLSSRFGRHLRSLGVGPDALVGLYIGPSLEMVVGLLGILKAGGAYLPLDRTFPRERLAFMLDDAQPPVVATLAGLKEEIPAFSGRLVCLDDFREEGAEPPAAPASEQSLAYVLYTSGSTGRPKGVEIVHGAVVNFLDAMQKEPGMTAADTMLSVTTLSFDILGLEIWLPLVTGARVVLAPPEAVMDGKRLARIMADCGATVMQATPATWRLLLEAGWRGDGRLKVLCGGEAWPRELAGELLSRCGSLWNLYGPTETTIWSAVDRVREGEAVRIGRPIANTTFYVADPRRLQPLPRGAAGELLIGGDGLARGYRNRPELSAEKFIPDPFGAPGSRVYRTGDLVRSLPDGRLEFLGRLDHQVKIRGFRIELADIESVLSAADGVKQAVVNVHDAGGEKQLVAYVVPDAAAPAPVSRLRQLVRDQLPSYMVPNHFVTLERLPLTPNGKIDRKALPAPSPVRSEPDATFIAPRTDIERTITAIWQDVLQLEKIGVNDNFFDLGGHSLRMARVHSRLREALRKDLSMVELFKYPTVESLVRYLSREENEARCPQTSDDRREKLSEGRSRMRQRFLKREQAARRDRERSAQDEHNVNA
jgi:amino acid adenylation domain-containing protein